MRRALPFAFVFLALSGVACSAADPITNQFDFADCSSSCGTFIVP